LSPVGLGELLAALPHNDDPNLLVGFATSDDAAVYRLNAETAVISTADIITPPVDDPHLFGQIAAANALSDIFAMGGRPLMALNLAGFPSAKLEIEVLHGILAGAASKVMEAGALVAGGHTTEDDEPKFGLAVTGLVHPERVWSNAGARPGDRLILTKPIGSGVLFNANRKGWVSKAAMERCLEVITTLNKTAAEVAGRFTIHAATDITGFGLAGHSLEMARGSGVTVILAEAKLPILPEALEMYRKGMTTGVNDVNRQLVAGKIRHTTEAPRWQREILVDPQTSGGLLLAVPQGEADALLAALHEAGVTDAVLVGRVEAAGEVPLVVEG
jgi:selenide,water dikinase